MSTKPLHTNTRSELLQGLMRCATPVHVPALPPHLGHTSMRKSSRCDVLTSAVRPYTSTTCSAGAGKNTHLCVEMCGKCGKYVML